MVGCSFILRENHPILTIYPIFEYDVNYGKQACGRNGTGLDCTHDNKRSAAVD